MLELRDIAVVRQGRAILQIERLALNPEQVTVILGHNGSGKSTLINLLARQTAPDRGELRLDGTPLERLAPRALARRIAFLPQQLPPVAGLDVRELVLQGRYPWRGLLGRWQAADHAAVAAAMAQTDVSRYADTPTDQLSGGERQRAWIAMLLAQESPLLLLDEPTSALDLAHQYELMELLKRLNRERGRGLVVILHDINLACRYADRIVALKRGRIDFDGTAARLLDEARLSALYDIDIRLCPHPSHSGPVAVVA